MERYRFVGEGAGVPGLPHEVTAEEAAANGVADILAAAVKNGSYRLIEAPKPKPKPAKSAGESE